MDEESIFLAALQTTLDARAAFLKEACGGNADLRRNVERLLEAHVKAGEFLEDAAVPSRPTIGESVAETHGAVIGPYKLLQQIGEGGMGTVWMAEQTEPVRRKVALKLIRPGMDSRQVIARFEAERQALALMDHPNIAKVLDAGTTNGEPGRVSAGRPYFVMELVKGVPITTYCDERHLTPKERLELFVPICQAVQHAHQKGIIHRDLKPSNVLVALYDGKPVPKVIDFGVAKAAGPRLTEHTLFTEFGAVVGTLEYMSPEQAELNQLDIDTRSDIYALGVLLYELLTGTTPLERKRLKQAALLEMLRAIREEEPPKPSTRLSTTDELPSIAANRGLEPKKLSGLVRGELDWIVMKCLEKDRNRRYETANGLAMDLLRYLADDPVQACPPTAGYRLRKLLRKHRTGVLMTAAFMVFLSAAAAVSTWMAVRATQAEARARTNEAQALAAVESETKAKEAEAGQRRQAEAVAGLLEMVFAGLDPRQTMLDLKGQLADQLGAVATRLEHEYAGEPLVRARLRNALGLAHEGLGESARAAALHKQALAERQTHLGPDHRDTLKSMNNLAATLHHAGRLDEAMPLFEQTLERRKASLGPNHPDTLESMNNFGMALKESGDGYKAAVLLEEVLEKRTAVLGPDDRLTLNTMNNLALAYQATKRMQKALPLFEQCLERRTAILGPDHAGTLTSMNNLATAYFTARKPEKALPLFQEVLREREALLTPHHPQTLTTANNLATVYLDAGRVDEAIALYERVLAGRRAKLPPDHPETLITMNTLATAYKDKGRLPESIALYEQVLTARRAKLKPDHIDITRAIKNLAMAHVAAEQFDRAESLLREVHARQEKGDREAASQTLANLGYVLMRKSKFVEAEPLLRECLSTRMEQQPDEWGTFNIQTHLGAALLGQQEFAESEPLLVQGYLGLKQRAARISPRLRNARLSEAVEHLVQLYATWEKPDEAAKWRRELEEVKGMALPPKSDKPS